MNVNFEFLSEEPIENIITCMHYRIDKVVFFGYQQTIERQKDILEHFLMFHCNVKTVNFLALSQQNLQSMVKTMRQAIQLEKGRKNQLYFDITGGESLILIAFGMLASEFNAPMHLCDIYRDTVDDLKHNANQSIRDLKEQSVPLTLDLLIRMRGGRIDADKSKAINRPHGVQFYDDIDKIYAIASYSWKNWSSFTNLMRTLIKSESGLLVNIPAKDVLPVSFRTIFNTLLNRLQDAGTLLDVEHTEEYYQFRFKNHSLKECLMDTGSVLEQYTFRQVSPRSTECQVGVHIDWDGVLNNPEKEDVLNEIDVLALQGNIPVFISCKSGKLNADKTLYALYELGIIARRFGGKYARRVLVAPQGLHPVYMERAAEMGIEVRCETI